MDIEKRQFVREAQTELVKMGFIITQTRQVDDVVLIEFLDGSEPRTMAATGRDIRQARTLDLVIKARIHAAFDKVG